MKILFNCANNTVGGAVQNAANFIAFALKDPNHDFRFLVSTQVASVLSAWSIDDERVLKVGPERRLFYQRQMLRNIESNFKPDFAYTMAGPSYLSFGVPHVLGLSDPYISHATLSDFFYGRSLSSGIRHVLKTIIKGFFSRIEADSYIFQTVSSEKSFRRRWRIPDKVQSYVVPNAVGNAFLNVDKSAYDEVARKVDKDDLIILCPCADYPHKDIFIIERIARIFSNSDVLDSKRLNFLVTVPFNSKFDQRVGYINDMSDKVSVKNIGPFNYSDAQKIYREADVVFMPSILETFSTTYLEAMFVGRPLVAADKAFAREICEDSAVYFRATDAKSACDAITFAGSNSAINKSSTALKILARFGSFDFRYKSIIGCLESFFRSDVRDV